RRTRQSPARSTEDSWSLTDVPHEMDGNSLRLASKVALITGAARGLGRAYALRLADLGADIVINDIRLDAHREFEEEIGAESVVAEVEARRVRALGIEADVTKKEEVNAMVDRILSEFGRLDILVNNAGGM